MCACNVVQRMQTNFEIRTRLSTFCESLLLLTCCSHAFRRLSTQHDYVLWMWRKSHLKFLRFFSFIHDSSQTQDCSAFSSGVDLASSRKLHSNGVLLLLTAAILLIACGGCCCCILQFHRTCIWNEFGFLVAVVLKFSLYFYVASASVSHYLKILFLFCFKFCLLFCCCCSCYAFVSVLLSCCCCCICFVFVFYFFNYYICIVKRKQFSLVSCHHPPVVHRHPLAYPTSRGSSCLSTIA